MRSKCLLVQLRADESRGVFLSHSLCVLYFILQDILDYMAVTESKPKFINFFLDILCCIDLNCQLLKITFCRLSFLHLTQLNLSTSDQQK